MFVDVFAQAREFAKLNLTVLALGKPPHSVLMLILLLLLLRLLLLLLLATPPSYPLPLLPILLRHIRFTRYLQHFRHVGTSYEASNFTCEFSSSSIRFWTCFWGGGGVCGKNDDDIVTPTPRTTSPEELFYSVFTVLS